MKHPFGMNASQLETTKSSLRELTIDEVVNVSGAKKPEYTTLALDEEGGSEPGSKGKGKKGDDGLATI